MRGWRPALRLAWRDAWRAKGRSILVLVMIALPVLAVTAASVVQATSEVDGVDAIPRTMGASQARIEPVGGVIVQPPDPGGGIFGTTEGGDRPRLDDLAEVLGDREVLSITEGEAGVDLDDRRVRTVSTEVDLRHELTVGLFELRTGELPAAPGEVVVNEVLAGRGLAVGDALDVLGSEVTVVGIGQDATWRDTATITALPGTFGAEFDGTITEWLVGGDDLTWSEVQELNAIGALVYSRAVIEDPPAVESDEQVPYDSSRSDYIAVVALVVVMALLEVVLLAGPAFAVGARRQARTLALMAACGGTPRQARRVVLASGLVLGAVAAVLGALLGVLLGVALVPVVQQFSNTWFGPVDVDWRVVVVVAAFGLLSAFLAAVVPARLASKQDVVAVLAGRRGDAPPSARTPVFGVVLIGVGMALSVAGAQRTRVGFIDVGQYAIAVGAIVSVFGMIFVMPLVVTAMARVSGRWPLVARYAARDAARHRTRTVPAIAAVAATVAGVVALGIANSSDEAQNRQTYTPILPMGAAVIGVSASYDENARVPVLPPDDVWKRIDAALDERLPGATPEVIRGQRSELANGDGFFLELVKAGDDPIYGSWGGAPSNAVTFVSDGPVPGMIEVDDEQRADMSAGLEAGRAVVLTQSRTEADDVTVRRNAYSPEGDESDVSSFTWPAVFIESSGMAPVQVVLPSSLAEELDAPVTTIGYYFSDADLGAGAEKDLTETLAGIEEGASLYVERGYQATEQVFILLLILFTLGAVLMLGGTLTSTFLALSDARPDLATLAAVGAAPRSRRGVAASYALVVGFVGAVLGAMVGFIPGVAITYPLTSQNSGVCTSDAGGMLTCETSGPFLDIPWLMIIGLVLALPLLTALIVGLATRSRLPLAARLT